MNRQTVIILVMVLTITTNADTIGKQSSSLSPSSVTANVPSTLLSDPQIPSNNKPQPVKGPTVDSVPAEQPVILNNTGELKTPEQFSKKEEISTPLNSTTTSAEEIPLSVDVAVMNTNQTDLQKQQVQPITVIDAKGSKGDTAVLVIEKSEIQASNQDKLQRQAVEQKKARESLMKSNKTETVKAQPAGTVTQQPKNFESATVNISEHSNTAQNVQVEKVYQNKDKKTLEKSIETEKKPEQKVIEKQKTSEQVIVVDIAKVEATNKTTPQQEVDSEDQLQVQNETQTRKETTARPQIIKQKSQPSNEILIIPLDNQQDEQTQEEQDEEEEVDTQIVPVKEKSLSIDVEKQVKHIDSAVLIGQDAHIKDNKAVNVKKQQIETHKSIVTQQKSPKNTQTKKETVVQPKMEQIIKQQEAKQKANQQINISNKKQSSEQKQIPKAKEDAGLQVTKPREKIAEHDEKQIMSIKDSVSYSKTAKDAEKSINQSPKSDITKNLEKENSPQEHTSYLRRQQHQKPVIEKDIHEIQVERPKKTEQSKQKTSIQREPQKKQGHEQSLQQLLEEVKSDLSKDAKTKIIQHLENQIKQQQANKITVLEEKPDIQTNQYLQLETSSPRQGVRQPEKEEEVSSEEIMDTKTVIVIIILTFIISIPIVREIKSKDSQAKESKNKMQNDLKESSQTLGLEFSELDNQTGYGEPLDQEER